MSDSTTHKFALSIISLAFFAKLVSLLLIGDFHWTLKWIEFISIGTFCAYIGWLGFIRREFHEDNRKYILYATLLVILDITTYYALKGWA